MRKGFIAIPLLLLCLIVYASEIKKATINPNMVTQDIQMNGHKIISPGTVDGVDVSRLQTDTTTLRSDFNTEKTNVRISTDSLQTQVDAMEHGALGLYLTKNKSLSGQYYVLQSTIPAGTATFVKSLTTASVVFSSFTTNTPLNLTMLKGGTWHLHFHANVTNVSKTTRIQFKIYNGTGTAESLLVTSEVSNPILVASQGFDIHGDITDTFTTVSYLSMHILATTSGSGANPTLTFNVESPDYPKLESPVDLPDIIPTKLIAGTNISLSPTTGIGNVTINADLSSRLYASSGTTIAQALQAEITNRTNADATKFGKADGDTLSAIPIHFSTPTASLHDVLMVHGSSVSWGKMAGGGGSDNKNRSLNLTADSFYAVPSVFGNVAQITSYGVAQETYDSVVTSGGVYVIQMADSSNHNIVQCQAIMPKEWDSGNISAYYDFVTSNTSAGNVWLNFGISTAPSIITSWVIFQSTTAAANTTTKTSGVFQANATITGTGIQANIPFYIRVGRKISDTCKQAIYGRGCSLAYTIP